MSLALALRYRGCGVIFALHSVVADDAFHPNHTLRCPVGTLAWVLRRLRRQDLDIVTLDEVVQQLNAPAPKPFAAFTFDDGFADNLTLALPLMEKYATPFTVYVPTGMIGRDIDAWWFGVAEWIRRRDRVELPGLGHFVCADAAGKQRTYAAIEAAIHHNFDLLPTVREALATAGVAIAPLVDQEALTEKQLRTLAQHPLVTIGGHTTTHLNLGRAPAATATMDMAITADSCRTSPASRFGTTPIRSAIPAPAARARRTSRAIGFRTAVTTRPGAIFSQHRNHLHALPRICVTRDENASTLHCKLNGFSRATHSRLGDPGALM